MVTNAGFRFEMRGLTDREGKVVDVFLERATKLAEKEQRPLDIDIDGLEILTALINEMLPDYSIDQALRFTLTVLDQLDLAIKLSRLGPEGRA